ncbi:sensor domain-containing diguanylate cyclase [Thiomonas arsenitoxydans]|jgi:diguanylate cyclase (GGDEF)-like protein|uniref:sensor domain-containing diguanylate cyclase n=1 Tax=Thiomonas arsenitoxydans (strain DSM 22701 / CIP 110005 / 3As) TaxID=426114 RepID=UPI001ACAE61B|nr:diguanylate cyclase [Thiomonas arsenitoxydans]MBN8775194.1 diguanylate cyclase [Thiomonas arsenitoxydans]
MPASPLTDPEILQALTAENRPLPSPSAVALELMRALERRDLGMRDIANIARKDPALVARMIQLANSAIFAGMRPAVAIEEAVLRIGTGGLARLAIALSLMQASKATNIEGFDLRQFWMTSIQRGLVFQYLSQRVGKMPSAEAFSLGLLADVGQLAMAVSLGAQAVYIGAEGSVQVLQDPQVQLQRYGYDQGDASAVLLAHWGFPQTLAQAVRIRPQTPGAAGSREAQLGECVALSRSLQLRPGSVAADAGQMRSLAEHLQLSESDLQGVLASAAQDMAGMAAVFEMKLEQAEVDAQFDRLRRALATPPLLDEPIADEVLIVSKDAALRLGLRQALESAGHALAEAATPAEAFEIVQIQGPRVVVLDWADGDSVAALCRSLRTERGPRIYLLALSRDMEQHAVLNALDAGANDVLFAPVLPQMLIAKVQTGARATRVLAAAEAERSHGLRTLRTLEQRNAELLQAAGTDELTGVGNRRALDAFLPPLFAQAAAEGQPLACLMFDLDEFKRINDRLGHDVGDQALRAVGRVLRQQSRGMDFVARVGGEEFLMLCPQTTEEAAMRVAERIRAAIAVPQADLPPLSVSVGVALGAAGFADAASLIRAADQALLQAKRLGRNRVCLAPTASSAAASN